MRYIVGTRGSKLAMTQTGWVVAQLKERCPRDQFDIRIIETKGDRIQDVPLSQVGGSGIFVKELEGALLRGEVDLAVHSLKDMPSEMAQGLELAAFPKREDHWDVLLTCHKIDGIEALPSNPRIGTGSLRRRYQFDQMRPDALFEPIRGNVDTRIAKLRAGLDGIILAQAGINRLMPDLDGIIQIPLDTDRMLPAPCQGILGLQTRSSDRGLIEKLGMIDDERTRLQALQERGFLRAANGNCHIPIGCFCRVLEGRIEVEGLLGHGDGRMLRRERISGEAQMMLGSILGQKMMKEVGL